MMIVTPAGTLHGTDTARGDVRHPQVWLLHGVFSDRHLWDDVARRAQQADGVPPEIVTVDAPGHGSGPPIHDLPTLDDHASALGHAIRAHGRTPVVLAGHSWGGMLGLRLAAAEPDLIGGLLLTNTPLLRTAGTGRLGFRSQRAMLRAGFPVGVYGRVAARALYGASYRRRHPDVANSTAEIVGRLGRRGAIAVLDRVLLEPHDAVDLLTGLELPVRILAGADDYAGAPAVRAHVAARGHDVVLHQGGHMGPREAPAAVAEALWELIDRAVWDARPTTDARSAAGSGR